MKEKIILILFGIAMIVLQDVLIRKDFKSSWKVSEQMI